MNCDFCLNAIPKFPLTWARMKDPSRKIKMLILKNPFQSAHFTITYLITTNAINKQKAFSIDAIKPKMPNPSIKNGRNQNVKSLKNRL